jgi:hypothetical protein
MEKPIRQRPEESVVPATTDKKEISKLERRIAVLTAEENQKLNRLYNILEPLQIEVARMEASGISDRSIIANKVGRTPSCINAWRSNPYYKKLVQLNLAIFDRINREMRTNMMKSLLEPVLAELQNKIGKKGELEKLGPEDLLDMLIKIGKEVRADDSNSELGNVAEEDLVDLQKRRPNVMILQRIAINKLVSNTNIVSAPTVDSIKCREEANVAETADFEPV